MSLSSSKINLPFLKEVLFETKVSSTHIWVFLIIHFISVYFKDIVQIFLPSLISLIVCFIYCTYFLHKYLIEGKSTINNFNFYVPNDKGQYSFLIDNLKSSLESKYKTEEFDCAEIGKHFERFDKLSNIYKDKDDCLKSVDSFGKYSSEVNTSISKSPIISNSNLVTSTTISMTSTCSSLANSSCNIGNNLIYSTANSMPVSSCVPLNVSNLNLFDANDIDIPTSSNYSQVQIESLIKTSSNDSQVHLVSSSKSPQSVASITKIFNEKTAPTKIEEKSSSDCASNGNVRSESLARIDDFIQQKLSSLKLGMHEDNELSISTVKDTLALLPYFSGSLEEFRNFKHKFITIVDHLNLTNSSKALLLYLSITDHVIQSIGSVTVGGKLNYQLLWKLLEEEYCSPQYGNLYHGAAFNSLTEWETCDNLERLKKLYKFILLHHRALERRGE